MCGRPQPGFPGRRARLTLLYVAEGASGDRLRLLGLAERCPQPLAAAQAIESGQHREWEADDNGMLKGLLNYDPRILASLYGSLALCAWIGCWIATRGIRRPARFGWTFARGILGGAIGGLFDPLHFIGVCFALLGGLADWGPTAGVKTLLVFVGEGALLSLPLAILIARRKGREPQVGPQSPTPP